MGNVFLMLYLCIGQRWMCSDLSLSLSHQVDLLIPTKITGLITQGAKDFGRVQFVGSYKVAFSDDGEHWLIYQDDRQQKDKVRFIQH